MNWREWLTMFGFKVRLEDGTHYVAPGPYLYLGPAQSDDVYNWEVDGL